MIDFEKKSSYGVEDLREIVRILRAPGGCPWDREQDHHSIRRNLLEEVSGSGEVLQNWEELKKREKHQTTAADSVDSVARSLPGLWRAEKIQKKAAKVGFDWPDVSGALEKLREEAGELEEAVREDTNVAEELGDLLFAAVNVARFVKVDPEDALSVACDKFARRFRQVEASAAAQGKTLDEITLAEMDRLWDEAKKQEA